ncbi:RHS repeat domain-containing protein [Paenibacillus sp. sgz5001063]|uniref:RHS repeat domain-containing protein n=1 Tax=Paenibacillus sp. sgz5001063 TaxID=3242474 RepID=UPI0036D36042
MSYLASGDPSNDWEPTPGASGASASGSAPKTLYYLSDALGSVIGLEGQDGSISARYRYDEFGVTEKPKKFDLNWSGPDNLFGYTSLGYDYYSGYSHAQARDFDSSVGRFINEDTYEGELTNPLTLNLYTYVQNNPLRFTDPSGNMATSGLGGLYSEDITKCTLAYVAKYYPERWKFDKTAKGFFLAQQYYLVWYYGTKANERLGEGALVNNSYLVYKLNSLQKKGRDLSSLTVAEMDQLSFKNAGIWFKVNSAALGIYSVSSSITPSAKGAGNVRTFTSTDKYVGETANAIEARYPGKVVDVNKKVYRADGTPLTDYDIELDNAIIQVKQGGGKGATRQAINTASSTNKEVIVYLPDQSPNSAVVKGLQKEGFQVFTNEADLINHVGR